MSKPLVRQALESRLDTWAKSQSPAIPVAYENVSFTKPIDGIWLECFLLPNSTVDREITGQKHTLTGFFQVNVWCKKGIGTGSAEVLAEQIVALYPVVPKAGAISTDKTPTVGKPLSDDSGWIILPVLIQYRYET